MELSGSPEEGITMPISVSYGPIHESSSKLKTITGQGGVGAGGNGGPARQEAGTRSTSELSVKPAVRYRECLKNHAASIGGHAVDGCGEFLPSGEEGTLEALKCAACSCHRNFHRREVEGEPPCYCFSPRKRLAHMALSGPPLPTSPMMVRPSAQMIMALPPGHGNDSEDHDMMGLHPPGVMPHPSLSHHHHHPSMALIPKLAKRFRTKFTAEQREKMYAFAEKLGWRIQKHDEAGVQQFCNEVGVKRHVFKVWMHNNKHTFGKKLLRFPETFDPVPDSA